MEEFKFTADMLKVAMPDFPMGNDFVRSNDGLRVSVADLCNQILAEHLDKCPTVCGFNDGEWWAVEKEEKTECTHEAKLFNIKTIMEGE